GYGSTYVYPYRCRRQVPRCWLQSTHQAAHRTDRNGKGGSMTRIWLPALCLCTALSASAQDKRRVSFVVSGENSKYTQTHSIEVGDTQEHQLRLYELKRTFPVDAPLFEGARLSELWIRGISDFMEVNGLATAYSVY